MEDVGNAVYSFFKKIKDPVLSATVSFQKKTLSYCSSQEKPYVYLLLPNWMKELNDSLPVSMLSIPGTHNSASYACKFFQAPFNSQCQSWSIYDQLRAGIRFLDIRINAGKTLFTAHGIVKFQPLSQEINQISNFLRENPTEFVIIAFKLQNGKNNPSEQILDLFIDKIEAIFSENIPTVGELRGKVWILTSNQIPFQGLPTLQVPGGAPGVRKSQSLHLQNMWHVNENGKQGGITIQQKVNHVLDTVYAIKFSPQRMKLNFLSAANVGLLAHPHPFQLAINEKGPNSALNRSLNLIEKAQLGVTIMDFPGQELIHQIVACNFR